MLTREQRETLRNVHSDLCDLHRKVNEVTIATHQNGELAEETLNAQLAISDAMRAVHKAMFPDA